MNINSECWMCREERAICLDPIHIEDIVPTLCHDCAMSRLDRAIEYKRYLRSFNAQER